jgi:DNA-binding response OmpR family regulator
VEQTRKTLIGYPAGHNMNLVRSQNKILLVDDEPDIMMAFKLTLEKAGFVVDTYPDPIVALSEFRPNSYDLVILDIKMPKMNGFELHTEIRKLDQQVKVCFVTAGEMYYDELRNEERRDREKEEQYCKLDGERFLQKPISNMNLVKRIEKIVTLRENIGIA